MAETNVSAAKVFNYICGIGGFAEFSKLLTHPSPLVKRGNASSVVFWYQEEDMSGSFDGTHPLILATNKYGSVFGIRINLKKKICLKYSSTGLCHLGSKCECWHICKAFLEGTCKGNCGNSHDFHDNDNKGKTAELGFEKKENGNLKGIIAGSLPQVCLSYLKNECVTVNCPYVHICPKQVHASPCSCALSHDFSDSHNKNIFSSHFTFKYERAQGKEALCCTILVPTKQKPIEDNLKQLELHQELTKMQALSESKEINDFSAKAPSSTEETRMAVGKGNASSSPKGAKPLPAEKPNPPQSQGVISSVSDSDCLPKKVFNYFCNEGGFVTLTDLLKKKNSPLGKKSYEDVMLWFQAQSKSGQNTFFNLLRDGRGEIFGVQLLLRKKLCLQYSKGSCTKSKCNHWHICKGFLEGKCQVDCGFSHNFHDECNLKKVKKFELEKQPNKRVKDIVVNSLPQICLKYTENMCFSTKCPYLHVCSLTAQGKSCSCNLSHDLVNADVHNMAILEQFDLVPQVSKLEIVLCNILIPQQQRNLNDNKVSVDCPFSSKSHLSLQNIQASPAPLPLAPQVQSAVKSSVKKARKRTRRKKKLIGAQTTETDANEDIEGNLISFSDDDLDDVNDPVDTCFLSNYELLSQVDDIFCGDWLNGSSNTVSSQKSGPSTPDTILAQKEGISSSRTAVDLIFQCILQEYNGQVPFSVISQHQEILSTENIIDTSAWLKEHPEKFMTIENKDGQIEAVRAFDPRAKICFQYLLKTSKGCKDPECFSYHICMHYLANGVCPFGMNCRDGNSHNLRSEHNEKVTSKLNLKAFSGNQLCILISGSVPEVCLEHNSGLCERGFHCNSIHICKKFLMKECKKGGKCRLGHASSLTTPESRSVLEKYHLTKIPSTAVLEALSMRQPVISEDMVPIFHNGPDEDQHGKQGVLGASNQMAQFGCPPQVASEMQKPQRPPDLLLPLVPLPQCATTVAPNLLPLDWTAVPNDEEYIRVPLALGSDGFKLAKSLFVQSMPESKATILAIERVQNQFLWEKYARKREHLEKRSRLASSQSNERILFYGAKQENIESICTDNIDCRGQDEKRVAAFGQGAYFTTEASLSNTYSKQDSEGVRYMFLADVLVGSYTKGEPSLTRPPHKGDVASNKRYDSCVDNTDRPTIYVLFDSDQYYPNYLIRYRIKSKVACHFTKAVG